MADTGTKMSVSEIHRKRLHQVLELFDVDATKTINTSEISAVIYSLDMLVPADKMQELVRKITHDDPAASIATFFDMESVLLPLMEQSEYQMCSPDVLLQAFKMLDKDESGAIDVRQLRQALMEEAGDKLTDEEMDRMVVDCTEDGNFFIEDYISTVIPRRRIQ